MSMLEEMYLAKYRLVRGQLHPILRFALSCNGRTTTVEAYVDSGETFSLFSPDEAKRLGIEYKSGRPTWVRGIGGTFVPVYLHTLCVLVGHFSFKATVGFSAHIGVGFNLLGRRDIFKRLSFTFNDKYNFLLIGYARDIPALVKAKFEIK